MASAMAATRPRRIAPAFFGTILVYLVAQEVLGEGLAAMALDRMVQGLAHCA
jgi:hypothetical protein